MDVEGRARALVRGVDRDDSKRKLARSMIERCHDLGKIVIAEGVEEPEEKQALVELECDLLQGYLLGAPGKGTADLSECAELAPLPRGEG